MILRGSRFASWSAAVSGSLRVVAAALLAAAAVTALLPGSVAAAGACTFAINGVPLDAAATQDQAIVVGIEDDASLTASGPGPLGNVVVQAEFWPITVPAQSGFTDQSEAEGTVSPGGRGAVQGLYHVVVTSDNPACLPSVGWVRIVGAGPFDSIPGKVGGVLALVGIGVLLLALRSALAGGGGRRVEFIGGALVVSARSSSPSRRAPPRSTRGPPSSGRPCRRRRRRGHARGWAYQTIDDRISGP